MNSLGSWMSGFDVDCFWHQHFTFYRNHTAHTLKHTHTYTHNENETKGIVPTCHGCGQVPSLRLRRLQHVVVLRCNCVRRDRHHGAGGPGAAGRRGQVRGGVSRGPRRGGRRVPAAAGRAGQRRGVGPEVSAGRGPVARGTARRRSVAVGRPALISGNTGRLLGLFYQV